MAISQDGSDDKVLNAANLVPDDAQGTMFQWVKLPNTTANHSFGITASDDSGAVDELPVFFDAAGFGILDFIQFLLVENGSGVNTLTTPNNSMTSTDWALIIYGSNGSSYFININNSNQTLTVQNGLDDGKWFSDAGFDSADALCEGGIQRATLVVPFSGDIADSGYYPVALTTNQIGALFRGVNPFGIARLKQYWQNLHGGETIPDLSSGLKTGTQTGGTTVPHVDTVGEPMENYLN